MKNGGVMVGTIDRFAVIAVEYGESVDGKGRILSMFATKEEAQDYMAEDAKQYYNDGEAFDSIKIYNGSASVGDTSECGCEWKIQEVNIPVYEGELD